MLNGMIGINKPKDFTSFDVIAKLRGILGMKRLGHSGTLDPMATGVLTVFVGNATKACDMVKGFKIYVADFKFGQTTDTQDITGKVLTMSDKAVTLKELEEVIPGFTGKIMQIPPMYSAVQVNGKRLYDLARQGIEVERKPREIEVEKIDLLQYDEKSRTGKVKIVCGKGTYIRTIINDIGEKLGCGGIMTALERTADGGFFIDDCYTFEQIQTAKDENRLENLITPIEYAFKNLDKIRLNGVQTKLYKNGVKLDLKRINNIKADIKEYAVYGYDNNFIGTAIAEHENGLLRVGKNLV